MDFSNVLDEFFYIHTIYRFFIETWKNRVILKIWIMDGDIVWKHR